MGYLSSLTPRRSRRNRACAQAVAAVAIEALETRCLLAAADPYISEFLTSNLNGIKDIDNERQDWIEIHNPASSPVNMAGWRLTDDPRFPALWTFPAVSIPANGYLLVFASDKRRAIAGQELHTNFKLKDEGEYLALSKPDGTITSAFLPTYPPQLSDVSYGPGPASVATGTFVRPGLPAKYLIPTPATPSDWNILDFNPTGWTDALLGLGFEKGNLALPAEAEPNNSTAAANIATYNFQPYAGNFYHMPLQADLSGDYFKLGDLQAGDNLTISVAGSSSRAVTATYAANPTASLYRGDTLSQVLLASDNDSGPGYDALFGRYAVSTDGNHYLVISRISGTARYDVGFWLENAGSAPLTGERVTAESEPNSNFTQADDLSRSWRPVQYLSRTAGTISSASDADYLKYEFKKGDLLTIRIDSTSNLDAKVSLLNASGTPIAWEDGSSLMPSPYDKDSSLYAILIPSDGVYYVKVESSNGTTGTYNADLYLSADAAAPAAGTWGTYANQVVTNLGPDMHGVNASAYVRVPFNAANPADITSLNLRMNYDDGFIAYLNGTPVASRNAPSSPNYASAASASHQATGYEDIDITPFKHLLREFDNVLAIHVLNASALDNDLLIVPELAYTSVVPGGLQYFSTPTPGALNQIGAQGAVADTKFSHDRGFYDAPFDLTLSTSTSGAQIRYTLDGTNPTATTGLLYTTPIRIDKTVTVKAAAFKTGFIPTNIDAQTYLFLDQVLQQTGAGFPSRWDASVPAAADYAMDPSIVSAYSSQIRDAMKSLPVVSLSMTVDDLFGAQGLYPKYNAGEKPVSVEFFNGAAEQFQLNAGIVVGGEGIGGTSGDRWKTYKLSLRLKFKSAYGESELDYPLFGSDAPNSYDTLILDAQINHTWLHTDSTQQTTAKYINDQYFADLQSAMSGAGPKGRFVHLYLNGLYWGVYDLHERPDEHFAADYFGGNDEDYDVIKHNLQTWPVEAVVNGDGIAFSKLFSYTTADLSFLANYQGVEQLLDIDAFIDYMLINFYGGNHDWAHKNWYATYNKVDPNGRWRFHSWDAEHTLEDIYANNTTYNDSGGPTQLHQRLLASPEYRLKFADHIRKHLMNGGLLTPQGAAALYQARVNEVYAAMIGESARWGDNRRTPAYTRDNWAATQQGVLNSFIANRTGILFNQLQNQGLYPALDAVSFSNYGGTFASPQDLDITHPNPDIYIYYTTDGSDPRLPGGALNPSAKRYVGSMYLRNSLRIQTRAYDPISATWSALTAADFIIGPPPALRITELHYAPQPPADSPFVPDDFEFIELQNLSSQTLDLQGFAFTDGITFTFPGDSLLSPGQRTVIVRNLAAFQSRYGATIPVAGVYTGSLSDNGERLTLATQLGQIIQSFTYESGWFGHVDGAGFSLVAIDPAASDAALSTKSAWRPSNQVHGAPGSADPGYLPGSIVINEALTHTDQPTGDWIELYNTTNQRIDLSGWFLSDSALNLAKYQLPDDTFIEPFGYLLFTQAHHFGSAFGLSELGDKIYLTSIDDLGNPGGYREDQGFDAARKETSFGRYIKSTGGSDFPPMTSPTPGAPNAAPLVGPVVISEFLYAPPAGADEYIELLNITPNSVPLYDPAFPANTWQFTAGVTYAFPAAITLAPKEYVLVVGIDPATFRAKYNIPASVRIFGPWTGALNNAGEDLVLAAPETPEPDNTVPYYIVDRVNYDDAAPWPTQADGGNASLVRKRLTGYGNDVANWILGPNGGSPGVGSSDTTPPTLSILPINTHAAIHTITFVFSEPVESFDLTDLRLTRNGGPNLLTASQTLATVDKITWTLSGLGSLTFLEGDYMIALDAAASDIADLAGNALASGAVASFSREQTALYAPVPGASFYLRLAAPDYLEIFANAAPPAQATYAVPLSSITTLVVEGTDDDDVLILDFSRGNFLPAGGIVFNAGNHAAGDSIQLLANGAVSAHYTPSSTTPGQGVLRVADRTIRFDDAESIDLVSFHTLTLLTPNSNDTLLLEEPDLGVSRLSGSSDSVAFTPVTLLNSAGLVLDTASNDFSGDGNDSLTVAANGMFLLGEGAPQLAYRPGAGRNLLTLSQGAWELDTNLTFDGPNTSLALTGSTTLHLPVSATLASLSLAGSARLTLAPANNLLLNTATLSLADNARLDLANNDLLVTTANLATLESYIRTARNNGLWNRPGLTTSTATSATTLGIIPKPAGFLVKFTYYGDVNGDGAVNLSDYFIIDSGYLNKRQGFANGDMNFDGEINLSDYFTIDSAYLNQKSPLASPSSLRRSVASSLPSKQVLKAPKKKPKTKPTFSSKKRIR